MKLFQKIHKHFTLLQTYVILLNTVWKDSYCKKCSWASKVCSSVCQKAVVPRLNYRKKNYINKNYINKRHSCEGNMLTVSFAVI